jgi:O-methyltransferase
MDNTLVVEQFHYKPTRSWQMRVANALLGRFGLAERVVRPPPPWMGNVESRVNVFFIANQVLEYDVPGDFVELGCNAGFSSTLLQQMLLKYRSRNLQRAFHVYDSFAGLPSVTSADEGAYDPGEMLATRDTFHANFRSLNLPLPTIHEGWFEKTVPSELPEHIAFAMIDADLYESTLLALTHTYPRLPKGGAVLFPVYVDLDVYDPPNKSPKYRSPGVKKACDEFLADKPEKVSVLYSGDYSAGYFVKR